MHIVDLNADVGEGDTPPPSDPAILDVVTSASVACGAHAGNDDVMAHTVAEAIRRGVAVGAHPSYIDREGFGRRPRRVDAGELRAQLVAQIEAVAAATRSRGGRIRYVKPHGALYTTMADDPLVAAAVAAAVAASGLVLLAPAGTPAVAVARNLGVEVATEAFADRAYLPSGRLADRHQPGSVITDPVDAAARAVDIATRQRVRAVDGSWIPIDAASICVHGDSPGAAQTARAVRAALDDAGVVVRPFAP